MENTGSYLLSDIDYYYQLLVNYELEEAAYAQYLEEFDRIVEPYLRDCPPETKEKLNHLGFKRAMRELPAGDDARKYLGILIASESYLTRALMSSLRLEAFSMEILRMRGNIQELVNECKKAFVASGDDFDYNAQFRAMERSLAIPLPARHGTTSTSPVRSWMTRSARRVKTSLFSATACCSD